MFPIRRIVIILTLCGAALAIYSSALLVRADSLRRENTLESLRKAVQLAPGNAEYHALLAEHLEAAGQNPDSELQLATELSPRESRYWIRRGFRAEVEQKYADSERYLLEARRVDKGFDPRWALLNYYFRRDRASEFWKATTDALEMSYGDLSPIFRLCLLVNDDPKVTKAALPPGRRQLYGFFAYLNSIGRLDDAAPLAPELAANATTEETPVFLDYCERQIGHSAGSALAVWNSLCDRHLLPFTSLSPSDGRIVTNGDFAISSHQGFDWRFGSVGGVRVNPDSGGETITFDGNQPDQAILLEQKIPVTAGQSYSIEYEYRLHNAPQDSGLRWIVQKGAANITPPQEPIAASAALQGNDWQTGRFIFTAEEDGIDRLSLEYRRTLGTIRWQGSLQLRRVASALAAGAAK